MEGFTYSNLFDTKGIEYLVVIAFLLLLIPFWLILNRQGRMVSRIRKVAGVLSATLMKIPQGIFYNKNHTWTFLERSGAARVGLDELLIHVTGSVNIEFKKKKGDGVRRGDVIACLEKDGKILTISSPISGNILDLNESLRTDPEIVREDPYGKGWICAVSPASWVADIMSCHLAGDATRWISNEVNRYKDFLSVGMKKYMPDASLIVLQDGGELVDGTLARMPEEVWTDFQAEFLAS